MENCLPLNQTDYRRLDNYYAISRDKKREMNALSYYNRQNYRNIFRNSYFLDCQNFSTLAGTSYGFRNNNDNVTNGKTYNFEYVHDYGEGMLAPYKQKADWYISPNIREVTNELNFKKGQKLFYNYLDTARRTTTSKGPLKTTGLEFGRFYKKEGGNVENPMHPSHLNKFILRDMMINEGRVMNETSPTSLLTRNYGSPYQRNCETLQMSMDTSNNLCASKKLLELPITSADYKIKDDKCRLQVQTISADYKNNCSSPEKIELNLFKEVDNFGRGYLNVPKLLEELEKFKMKSKSLKKSSLDGTNKSHPYFKGFGESDNNQQSKNVYEHPTFHHLPLGDDIHDLTNDGTKGTTKLYPDHRINKIQDTKTHDNQGIDTNKMGKDKMKNTTISSKKENKIRNKMKQSQKKYLLDKYLNTVKQTESNIEQATNSAVEQLDESSGKTNTCDRKINPSDKKGRFHRTQYFQQEVKISKLLSSENMEKLNNGVLKSNSNTSFKLSKAKSNKQMNEMKISPTLTKPEALENHFEYQENIKINETKTSHVSLRSINGKAKDIEDEFFDCPTLEAEVSEKFSVKTINEREICIRYSETPRKESGLKMTQAEDGNGTPIIRDTIESNLIQKNTELTVNAETFGPILTKNSENIQRACNINVAHASIDVKTNGTVKDTKTIETQTEICDKYTTNKDKSIDMVAISKTTISSFEERIKKENETLLADTFYKIILTKKTKNKLSEKKMSSGEKTKNIISVTPRFQEAIDNKSRTKLKHRNGNDNFFEIYLKSSQSNESVSLFPERKCSVIHTQKRFLNKKGLPKSSKYSPTTRHGCNRNCSYNNEDIISVRKHDSDVIYPSSSYITRNGSNSEIRHQRCQPRVRNISSSHVKWIRKQNNEIDEIDIALSYSTLDDASIVIDPKLRKNARVPKSSTAILYEIESNSEEETTYRTANITKSRMWEKFHTQYLEDGRAKKWYHFCFKP